MAKLVNMKEIVKHIANGTLNENLCRICLLPLNALNEDMFTKICKNDKEYCIADILDKICDIKIFPEDKYKICSDCFKAASSAYKFYLLCKRSEEILDFHISLLVDQINLIDISDNIESESLCIKIPLFNPETELFDYNLTGLFNDSVDQNKDDSINEKNHLEQSQNISDSEDDIDIVIIADENGDRSFFKQQNGSLVPVNDMGEKQLNDVLKIVFPEGDKVRERDVRRKRRRNPMRYINCSQCPVRYKFISKLKEHMKSEHDIDLFVCSICKQVIEDEDEFKKHLDTHTDVHKCTECNMVFKSKERIIAHQKWHDTIEDMKGLEDAHVCEICGLVLMDEEQLLEHNERKHMKKFTCYYCGRMYKGESSFEFHIKKHEMHMMGDTKKRTNANIKDDKNVRKKKFSCVTCERDFVDERSLMWHQRLHTNERPYVCDVCGRGFVSLNRRNQHAVCAHTAPARRCPLCPALFHLRSMVNTHVKKVHLKEHKRRNRSSKHQNVFWRTQPVPIQELSVSIQSEILELQAQQAKMKSDTNFI